LSQKTLIVSNIETGSVTEQVKRKPVLGNGFIKNEKFIHRKRGTREHLFYNLIFSLSTLSSSMY